MGVSGNSRGGPGGGWLGLSWLGGALLVAQSCLSAPFPPPAPTVVLFPGLAGDVESESTYLAQVKSWLEILQAAPAPARKVSVLLDLGEGLKPAKTLDLTVVPPTREGFLGLGPSLAGRTNPLVVVVWGHGGMQGSTPVLHVRGPRLTPADFKTLADQMPGTASQWILLFRGSGRFARALAAPGRAIVSSDDEAGFQSDPVAMSVLLKQLRSRPEGPFVAVAEELGRGVSAWYEERTLARTEAPTLWLGDQPPRALSPAAGGVVSAAVTNPPATKPAAEAEPPALANSEPAETTNLPPVWAEIHRVEPRNYPDSEAVTLRSRVRCTLASSPAIATEREEFVQILTAEGKHYGDFDLSFSANEDLSFQDCEVLRPDGHLVRLDPDAIREGREDEVGDYQRNRRKFFSLPGVGPGAVLHVRYTTEWKKFPLPHLSLELPLGSEAPVLDTTLTVSVPKGSPFHFKFEHVSAGDPALKQSAYGSTYTWHFEHLPPQVHEVLSPPGQQPRLLLSTFPDWAAFAQWYGRLIKLADAVTPEIGAKAVELTRGATNEQEKVVAIYNYVTGLRYVMVPLGVNSHRPHAAANVLHNQFGDCKDKANLFNTLLRSVNVEARLVLVPRFTQAHEGLPGLAFNHAISCVTVGGQTQWVDTTDDVCRFGMLPPGDPGRHVLVIDGKTTALTPLPIPQASDHRLRLLAALDLATPTQALPTTIQVQASGYPDYALRTSAREMKGRRSTLPLLAAQCRPANGLFALAEQHSTPVSALTEDYAWKASGTSVGLVAPAGDDWAVRAPFWLPREWDGAVHRRQAPLFLQQGYPLTLEEDLDFTLPVGTQAVRLPAAKENQEPPLSWRVAWKDAGGGQVRASLRAQLVRGELSGDAVAAFQQQVSDLVAACAEGVTFQKEP
jgi:hypothetical protein